MLQAIANNSVVKFIKSFIVLEHDEDAPAPVEYERRQVRASGQVVPINPNMAVTSINIKFPESIDDAREAVDCLNERKVVLMNLSKLEKDLAKEIVYYLSGAAYALGGRSTKIGVDIFMFTHSTATVENLDSETVKGKKRGNDQQNSLNFDEI